MKHSISKETEAYLQQLKKAELAGDTDAKLTDYVHQPDAIDQLIQTHYLRIVGLNFYADLDLMLVVLSNCKVMKRKLSDFPALRNAKQADLENYELSRYGVHWLALNEDLSLRGFLQYELTHADLALVA